MQYKYPYKNTQTWINGALSFHIDTLLDQVSIVNFNPYHIMCFVNFFGH